LEKSAVFLHFHGYNGPIGMKLVGKKLRISVVAGEFFIAKRLFGD